MSAGFVLAPVVSEKSYALIEQNVYTFRVHPDSSKPEIHDAVEAIFNVTVVKVNTLNRKGKRKRNRRSGVWSTRAARRGRPGKSRPKGNNVWCPETEKRVAEIA